MEGSSFLEEAVAVFEDMSGGVAGAVVGYFASSEAEMAYFVPAALLMEAVAVE